MKRDTVTTTALAYIALVFMLPISAPADPVVGQVDTPVATTKRALSPSTRMSTPITRQVIARPLATKAFATEAPEEVCVYDDNYSMGASNNGTIFCSKKLGYQDLPSERQGRISAADVPEGYVLVLYAGLGQSGATCRLVGRNAGLATSCDNMARGMLLEPNVGAAQAAQQEDANRRARETHAEAVAAGDIWAAGIKEQQEAAAAEEAARQAAHDAREAARRAAHDAREAAAADYERRRMEHRPVRAASLAASGGCLVKTSSSDGGIIAEYLHPNEYCWNTPAHLGTVGEKYNDDIEYVEIISPYVRVTFFRDVDYRGPSITLGCGKYELIDEPENEISSLIVELLDFPKTCENMRVTNKVRKWDR